MDGSGARRGPTTLLGRRETVRRVGWRLLRGDLRHRRIQSVLLLAVVVIATAGITAGLTQQRSAGKRWDAAFREANGAHVAVFGDRATLEQVAREPGVAQTAGPNPITSASLRASNARVDDVDVRGATGTRPLVGTPLPFAGRWLRDDASDEVVVERSLALDLGIRPGDRIGLEGPAGRGTYRVVGIELDLLDCFYPECDSATVWVTESGLARVDPQGAATSSLLLARLDRPDAVAAFEARIQDRYGTGVSHVLDWIDTRHDVLGINQFFGIFLAAFGIFLLFAAGLVILSSVSAMVLARYREFGVLKAVGLTPSAITAMVLAENLMIAVVGIGAGIVVGGLLAPTLQLRMAQVLERGHTSFPPDIVVLATIVVLVIITLATVVPAWRSGRVPASSAIARGAAPVSTKPSHLAGAAARLRLGTPVSVGLKDNGARPVRAWLTVLTLAVTVIAIVATLGLDRTVAAVSRNPAEIGDPFDLAVDPGGAPRPAIEAALDRPDVAAWFTATDRRGAVGSRAFHVRALGGDIADSGFVLREGRMIRRSGEAVLGYGLLQKLDLHVGDRFPLDVSGGRLDLRVVGRYSESEDSGQIAQISLADLRRVEPDADAGGYFVHTTPDASPRAIRRAVVAASGGAATVELVDTSTDELDSFRAAFYLISFLVLAVGFVNLLGTTLLGIRERTRDLGILKTIGFTPRQIATSVATGDAALAVAAVLVGIPLGLLVSAQMQDVINRTSGIGPGFGSTPTAAALLVTAMFIVVLAAALGATAARRAASASVADIVRTE